MVKLPIIIVLFLTFQIFLCSATEEKFKKLMNDLYGENREIKDDYNKSLSIECNNGIFVGLQKENVLSFKGIPYAKPPIGDLRWKDPVLAEDSKNVYQAYYFGKSPIQVEWETQPSSYYPQSEDCLHLNIWLNSKDTSKDKPVIVFIHGGSYTSGGTSDPLYDGHNLAEKFSDIIFITVDFRLGILGFINLSSVSGGENYKTSNNLGLLDIICALKWIQKNIKNFGGDPNKVTLMGQSSGGSSISLLPLIDESKGLFKRIIAESGPISLTFSLDETKELTKRLLKKSGAKNMDDLLKLSETKIKEIDKDTYNYNNYAVRDGIVLPLDIYEAYSKKDLKDIDFLLGNNKDEVKYWIRSMGDYTKLISGKFIYYNGQQILYENNLKQLNDSDKEYADEFMNLLNDKRIWEITEFYNDIVFRLPMTKQAEYHSSQGGNTYVYLWKYPGEDETLGACHNIELSYTLNNLDQTLFTGNKVNKELANKVQEMWANFARTGDPSISGITWEKYNNDTRKTMALDEKIEMIEEYKDEQREILEPLLKYYLNGRFSGMSYNVPYVYKTVFQIVCGLSILILIISLLKSLF
jgi:para-nitrobenzyl esterase